MIDLEKAREQELDAYLEKVGYNTEVRDSKGFRAGFTSGVAAVVAGLKADKRRAFDEMYLARQEAAKCGNPADAVPHTVKACELAARVDYLNAVIRQLTGE